MDSMALPKNAPSGISLIRNPRSILLRLLVPENESFPILYKSTGRETEKSRLAS